MLNHSIDMTHLQSLLQACIILLLKEVQIFLAVVQDVLQAMLKVGFRGCYVSSKVRKSHFRLDHPELCQVS